MNMSISGEGLAPSSVKIAGLWKRSQGLKRFAIGRPNYRHRVFILTEHALAYYSGTVDRIGTLRGRIGVESVRAVEFVEESAFRLAYSLQVIYSSRKHGFVTLYITARDQEQCADWVASLRQACCFNQDMLMHYHPGAHVRGQWSCCQQQNKVALGCQLTTHLLTRSSSRYAEMRRTDTLPRRMSTDRSRHSRLLSVCPSDGSPLPHIREEGGKAISSQAKEVRSSSCGNLVVKSQVAGTVFPLTVSHLSLASSALGRLSVGTSDADSESIPSTPLAERMPVLTERPRPHGGRHQIAPTTGMHTCMITFPQQDKRLDTSDRTQPVPSSQIMVDTHSRNSSISEDRNVDISVHRKSRPAIEPRVSDSNPDVIHV